MMQSRLASLSLFLSVTSALSTSWVNTHNDSCGTGFGSGAPVLGPRICPNNVEVSDIPNYYSTYLDLNPYYHYVSSGIDPDPGLPKITNIIKPGEDSVGIRNPKTIIPNNWYKDCKAETLCSNLATNGTFNGMWISDSTSGSCLLGFYLPLSEELTNGMKVQENPTKEDCVNKILGPMIAQLTDSVEKARAANTATKDIVNRASVNVKPEDFPKFFEGTLTYGGDKSNGSPVVPGWSRWVVEGYPGLPTWAQS